MKGDVSNGAEHIMHLLSDDGAIVAQGISRRFAGILHFWRLSECPAFRKKLALKNQVYRNDCYARVDDGLNVGAQRSIGRVDS